VADVDAVLVHRAEQALLGALLAGGNPAVVREVRPEDFTDPVHQALYAAITGQYRRGGRLRAWLARAVSLRVARAAQYAQGLPARCPRRSHLLAYGAMIVEARRQAAGDEPQDSGPDAQLAGADVWLSSATGKAGDRERLAPGTQRLARALAPIAKRLRVPVAPTGAVGGWWPESFSPMEGREGRGGRQRPRKRGRPWGGSRMKFRDPGMLG